MSRTVAHYEIRIYVEGEVKKTIHCTDKTVARSQYYRHARSENCYTELVVNGIPLNTAKAEKLLGKKDTQSISLF